MAFLDRFRSRKTSAPSVEPPAPPTPDDISIQVDRPIASWTEDRFDRAPFAAQVANIIARRADPSSLVVGIYGPWGDGKTSVLQLIREALSERTDVVAMTYNPWFYGASTEAITKSFFQSLGEALEKTGWFSKENIGSLVSKLGKAIPHVGEAVSAYGEAMSSESLVETREKIGQILKKHGKKVVVFIDDIDRLDRADIQTLFKLVRLSGDFDHTTYVLAFDDAIVAEALGEAYGSGDVAAGRRFLEKIVQVPLHLPPAKAETLRAMIFASCDRATRESEAVLDEGEPYELGNTLVAAFGGALKTPRQVKLFDNALTFAVPMLKGEVRLIDQILIEGLRVFYPTIYQAVRNNPQDVLRQDRDRFGPQPPASPVRAAIAALAVDDAQKAGLDDLITHLFPRTGTMGYGSEWDTRWNTEKRICSKDYFNRYFTYAVPTGDLSDVAVNTLVEDAAQGRAEAVAQGLDAALDRGATEILIRKLRMGEDTLPLAAAAGLARALSDRSDRFPRTREPFVGDWSFNQAAILVAHLIQKGAPADREAQLEAIVQNAPSIPFLVEVISFARARQDKDDKPRGFLDAPALERFCGLILQRVVALDDPFEALGDRFTRVMFSIGRTGGAAAMTTLKAYLAALLARDAANAGRFLRTVTGLAWGMDSGVPNVSDFDQRCYESLADLLDPAAVESRLRDVHGTALDADHFEYDLDMDVDLRLARQFSYLHHRPAGAGDDDEADLDD